MAKKPYTISFRLSSEDLMALETCAAARGVTVHEMARRLVVTQLHLPDSNPAQEIKRLREGLADAFAEVLAQTTRGRTRNECYEQMRKLFVNGGGERERSGLSVPKKLQR